MKLSQLMDNLIKDQDMMKEAVSKISNKEKSLAVVRKSHSFDGEPLHYAIDFDNVSEDFNTVSGNRRFSSILQ